MFACSTRFDNLHPAQVQVVFDALVLRHAELKNHLEYLRRSAGESDGAWDYARTRPLAVEVRSNIRVIHGAAVALFGVHILKRDEFWVCPELMVEPAFTVVG